MRSTKFRCPNPDCRVVLSIPAQVQGQRVRCAGCGQSFVVPPAALKTRKSAGQKTRRSKSDSDLSAAA